MSLIRHDEQPQIKLDRIAHRSIVTGAGGAQACELWEQLMPPGGHIPLHYHTVEETLTFLTGRATVTVNEETTVVDADTTVFVPAGVVHGVRNDGAETVRLLAFFPTIDPDIFLPDGTLAKRPWQRTKGNG
jgi:quercetin dioxygenase-like cupin family protein